jgi:hypothetical protein
VSAPKDKPDVAPVPRIALTRAEAAASLGMGVTTFDELVVPAIKTIRLTPRIRLIPTAELERWRAWQWALENDPPEGAAASPRHARLRPPADYQAILLADPCCYCGAPCEAIDHIDPVARGGDGDWANFTAACASCNGSKHARPLLLWMAER